VYITAVTAGAIASGIALVLFSLLVFVLKLPVAYSGFLSLSAFGTGCLVAGFFAGAIKRQGGLGAGVRAAVLFMIPVALAGVVLSGFAEAGVSAGTSLLNKVVVAVMCGAAGGVLGVNKNKGF
jgi:putative membrane protein (TIGR04086 family)